MSVITLTTEIAATIDVVFDLSRSIDLHVESTSQTNEKAIAGRTSGLIKLGETAAIPSGVENPVFYGRCIC